MPRKGQAPYVNTGHFVLIQTGPWEGKGSWLYKIACRPCGFEDFADCRDDAWAAYEEHHNGPPAPKALEVVEWEDF